MNFDINVDKKYYSFIILGFLISCTILLVLVDYINIGHLYIYNIITVTTIVLTSVLTLSGFIIYGVIRNWH